MWLPKDERRLLSLYTRKVMQAEEKIEISDEELVESLNLQGVNSLHDLKRDLHEKGLIKCTNLGRETTVLNVNGRNVPKESQYPVIRMTKQGFELGQKYNSWWGNFELFSKEYMWLRIVLSAIISLIGVIVTIIIA